MSLRKRLLIVAVVLAVLGGLIAVQSIRILKSGAAAYLYGYSLVLMDETRRALTHPDTGRAPINHFAHVPVFPDHTFRQVVRPNNDTLYSTAWIDLSDGPIVLTVPDADGRYYVMPFMDAWTNVFASVGKRTTGTGSGHYVVVGPGWSGSPPAGMTVIHSPTPMTWLIGRIQADGESDFPAVWKLQRQFTLTPLARWGHGAPNPGTEIRDRNPDRPGSEPSAKVANMPVGVFFDRLTRLMGEQPPSPADTPMLETLAEFGMEAGKPFDMAALGVAKRLLLDQAVQIARKKLLETAASDRSSENNWAVVRKGIGVYGTDYPVRAFVSLIGLGALTPEEAAYPNAAKDRDGRPLSGEHRYRIHFAAGQTPPVDAFWSLTMYDERGYLIENPIRRYAISDRDPLKYNPDGSLDILIQHSRPAGEISNWLPAPPGPFNVTMRLYLPKASFLTGEWKLPWIERVE